MAALAVGFLLPSPAPAAAQVSDSLQLHPGDVVRINVWRKPEYSGEFRVSDEGVLADPFYQDLRVTGVPFSTAAERIRSFIGRFEASPRVWVEPMVRITVRGVAGITGITAVHKGTSIGEVLASVDRSAARLEEVELVRGGTTTRLDLSSPTSAAAAQPVLSGDQIYVPRRRRSFLEAIVPYTSAVSAVGVTVSFILSLL